ncbi:MAG: hypothetical protein JSR50_05970 [Proteobacteria bacterium]|nr:hypothetical protein [Pseudomonadota bacterium]
MELDDFKTAWQSLNQRLDHQDAINLQLLAERKRDRLHASLRPLFWGQLLQILLGVALTLLGIACWKNNLHTLGYLLAGITLHAFGIANIVHGGITMALISGIDNAAPVLGIQKRLTLLRKFQLLGAVLLGLPWWVMWIVVVIAFAGLADHPPHAGTPLWVWINFAVGAFGLLATWGAYRWSHADPRRIKLAKWMDDIASTASIRKAQAQLDELRQFERE